MTTFAPRFTITNRITAALTTVERACGFLEAATLSEDWVSRMSQRALLLEAHHTTHIGGTQLSIEQAEQVGRGGGSPFSLGARFEQDAFPPSFCKGRRWRCESKPTCCIRSRTNAREANRERRPCFLKGRALRDQRETDPPSVFARESSDIEARVGRLHARRPRCRARGRWPTAEARAAATIDSSPSASSHSSRSLVREAGFRRPGKERGASGASIYRHRILSNYFNRLGRFSAEFVRAHGLHTQSG